jgi:hypothetical protein
MSEVLQVRQRYAAASLREEQLARALADGIGPIRADAPLAALRRRLAG